MLMRLIQTQLLSAGNRPRVPEGYPQCEKRYVLRYLVPRVHAGGCENVSD